MRRWWYKRILIMFVLLAMTMGTGFGVTSLQEQEENKMSNNAFLTYQKIKNNRQCKNRFDEQVWFGCRSIKRYFGNAIEKIDRFGTG